VLAGKRVRQDLGRKLSLGRIPATDEHGNNPEPVPPSRRINDHALLVSKMPIISVENLGKSYLLGHQSANTERYTTLRDVLGRSIRSMGRKAIDMARGRPIIQGDEFEEFWALKDVSFEVNEGEVVGIIGRNGAGKSTLLKILSRITEPTKGKVTLRGRVASLLEVGTGFHPELTGRENIFLNGAILGMSRFEIKKNFSEIVEFSEVERFLDTPVKRYSSGMYVRLAFAVAAHLDPEILVVDEVLAVGDAQFQKKCLGKIGQVASGGKTVLFVSHNMSVIQQLCTTSVLLGDGRIVASGLTSDVLKVYASDMKSKEFFVREKQSSKIATITRGVLIPAEANGQSTIRLELDVECDRETKIAVEIAIKSESGVSVGYANKGALSSNELIALRKGKTFISLSILVDSLAVGNYFATVMITHPSVAFIDVADQLLQFEIDRAPAKGRDKVLPQAWGYGCVEFPVVDSYYK
jgi:lipopolysaccharide transport system ATP-binding protein